MPNTPTPGDPAAAAAAAESLRPTPLSVPAPSSKRDTLRDNGPVAKRSAGILPYRRHGNAWQVLLVHPGGPFWSRKDVGAWSIAKGEYNEPETGLQAAVREFHEETGFDLPGPFRGLTPVRLKSGKVIEAWATPADIDASAFRSNTFELEHPKGSGVIKSFPEVDRIEWFDLATAQHKIHAGQLGLLLELQRIVGVAG